MAVRLTTPIDWPVAVICGILKTSYIQNAIGTLPAFLLVAPITLSGSMLLISNATIAKQAGVSVETATSAAAIILSAAVVIQGVSILAAMHFVEKIIREESEVFEQYPDDEAVKSASEKSNIRAKKRFNASKWKNLPIYMKFFILTGVLCETASLYLFALFGSRCFVSFKVTDTIAKTLNGNALSLVRPLGWAGMGLFAYGCLVLLLLGRWISCNMDRIPEEDDNGVGPGEYKSADLLQDDPQEDVGSVYNPRYRRCCGCFAA